MEDVDLPLVAHPRSSIVAQPGDRSFDLPATLVPPRLASILRRWGLPSSPARARKIEAASLQPLTMRVAVIGSFGDQRVLPADYGHLRGEVFDQCDLRGRSTRGPACHRNTLAINQKHPLGSLPALGFSDAEPPFFAGENVPSTNSSSQSSSCWSSSSSRSAFQTASSTPESAHSFMRRQHVATGNSLGGSFQQAPVLRIQSMPSRQRRSSAGGRPPRADLSRFGMRGLTLLHWASVSGTSRSAIEGLLSMAFVTEVQTGNKITSIGLLKLPLVSPASCGQSI